MPILRCIEFREFIAVAAGFRFVLARSVLKGDECKQSADA